MEVASNNYMPGDQRLIQQIVYELKSQGIFDNFRKECIADVDTKPAYQNLRQRVEGSVASFLNQQTWSHDMNKNQIREQLRKNIHDLNFLDSGVERIVEQVVNPKINSIFLPRVEDVVYRFLGITKPERPPPLEPVKVEIRDLLPMDLETVSPESNHTDRNDSINNSNPKMEEFANMDGSPNKCDDDESPPFEALESDPNVTVHNENSVDSHISGFSGVRSHENSNQGSDTKVCQMDISSMDSQTSQNSFESHLSIVTSEETKMEISEDSQTRLEPSSEINVNIEISNGTSTDITSDAVEKFENMMEDVKMDNDKPVEIETKPDTDENVSRSDEKKTIDKKLDPKTDGKEKSSSDKSSSSDRKNDRHSKNSKERSKSKHSSSSSSKDKDSSATASLKMKENSSSSSSSSFKDKEHEVSSSSKNKESSSSTKDKSKSKEKRDSKSSSSHKDTAKCAKEKNSEKHDKDKIKSDKSVDEKTIEKPSKDKIMMEKDRSDKEKSRREKSEKSSRERTDKEKVDKDRSKSDKEKLIKDKDKSMKDKEKSAKDKEKSFKDNKSNKDKHEKEKDRLDKDKDRPDKEKDRPDKEKDRSDKDKDKLDKGKDKSDKEKDKSDKDKDRTDKEKDRPDKNRNKVEQIAKDKTDKEKIYKHDVKEKMDKDGFEKKKEKLDKDKSKSTTSSKERSSSSANKDKIKFSNTASKDKIKSSSTDTTLNKSYSKFIHKEGRSECTDSKSSKGDSKSKHGDTNKNDEKHSHTTPKHSREKKKEKQAKDDHYSSKDKKGDRRSTDRDSNDGSSSKQSHSNLFAEKKSSHKATPGLPSSSGSGSNDSSSNSDPVEQQALLMKSAEPLSNDIPANATELQKLKYLKPKFASNFQEAIKIMKIRKQIAKLERQNQLGLSEIKVCAPLQNGLDESEKSKTLRDQPDCKKTPVKPDSPAEAPSTPIKTTNLSQESWEALEARLAQEMSNINYNSYSLCDEDDDYSISEIVISPVKEAVSHLGHCETTVKQKSQDNIYERKSGMVEMLGVKQIEEPEVTVKDDVDSTNHMEIQDNPEECNKVMQTEQPSVSSIMEPTEDKKEIFKEDACELPQQANDSQVLVRNTDECDISISTSDGCIDYSQLNSPPCYYLEKPSPSLEQHLQFLHDFVAQLELEVETSRTNFMNSHRGTKRKREDYVDVKNNNKADYEQSTEVKKRLRPPNTAISKAIKDKTNQSTDVISNEGFSLPLSPESDISNDKKEEEMGRPEKRRKSNVKGAAQRYSSDELYKPRPSYVGTRRTRSAKNV